MTVYVTQNTTLNMTLYVTLTITLKSAITMHAHRDNSSLIVMLSLILALLSYALRSSALIMFITTHGCAHHVITVLSCS